MVSPYPSGARTRVLCTHHTEAPRKSFMAPLTRGDMPIQAPKCRMFVHPSLDKVRQFVGVFWLLRQRGSSEDSFLALTENGLRVLFLVGLGPEREEKAAVEIGVSA